jgi:hypothetical protein
MRLSQDSSQRVIEVEYPEFKLVVTEYDLLKFCNMLLMMGQYADLELVRRAKDVLRWSTEEQINKLFVHVDRPTGTMLQQYLEVHVAHIG